MQEQEFIRQKLDYIHANPCRGKWQLCADMTDYEHSSARYYMNGRHAAYEVVDYQLMEDIDLGAE
jgi:hypothetical protein